jgi:D-serine deaminase-like pyridoxal phosphate-dependent protein
MVRAGERTVQLYRSWVGRTLDEVETPAAVVDLDLLEANVARMQDYADAHGIALWPHAKTHKSIEVGARQLAAGAVGLTVAKTGEAEVFHEAGVERLLVHHPTYGPAKWDRLAGLVDDGLELTIALDGSDAAEGLSRALARGGGSAGVLIEVDLGMRRTGVASPADAVALARRVDALPGLHVDGISGYPGVRVPAGEVRPYLAGVDATLRATRDAIREAGIRCERVSAGSTPTRYMTHETCISEMRPGTYVFLDRMEAPSEPDGGLDACALTILATVISTSVPGRAIIDAGSKTLTGDRHPDGGHGIVLGVGGSLVELNEEHGYIDLESAATSPRVGDRVRVIPNHACTCVNLHDALLGVRAGTVETVFPVAARGLNW